MSLHELTAEQQEIRALARRSVPARRRGNVVPLRRR